jgi:MYXO-CTERM domain-containing protein
MKISLALGSALALVLVSGVSSAAITTYKATLNGTQETPSVKSAATGAATLTYDDANQMLTGTVTHSAGLVPSMQHIHQAACGVAGGVVVALTPGAANTFTVSKKLSKSEETALVAGNFYVNIHSVAFPGGEIRGQLYLDGSGKVCPVGADAGTDAGPGDAGIDSGTTSGSSGASGTSGSSGASGTSGGTSGSNGATTTPADAGDNGEAPAADDGGCATAGTSSPGNGLAMAGLAGLGLALVLRSRKKTNKKS